MAGQHQYLNTAQRRELAQLVERCTTGTDRQRALDLLRRTFADVQHGRDIGTSLRTDLRTARQRADHAAEEAARLRRNLDSAENELAEWRNGQHAEQLPLDEDDALFDNALGEYPPLDGQKFMRRRGQWLPVQDAPAVDDYQPTATTR